MSKIDVLLVYPQYSYPKKSPPLGLAYLAAVLEQKGFSVKIADMSTIGLSCDDIKKQIITDKPRLVGISFMTNQFQNALDVAKAVKQADKNIPVITGGPHVSALPTEILDNESVDIAVLGEGETTINHLADFFIKGQIRDISSIKGIAYRQNGKVIINQPQDLIADLDSLPLPAWHLLPVDKYAVPATGGDAAEPVFAVISSRGCPNQCIFCDSHTIFGRKFRARSAQNIFNELVYLSKQFGVKQFDFVDDTITVNRNRICELCNLMISNPPSADGFKWMCNARVNTVDSEMLRMMKLAGCVRVEFGIESGDEQVLKNIKKAVTIEQIKNAHKMAKEAGLSIGSFVMVGNVGEDFSSVIKTKELLEQTDTDDVYIAIATPFPGTELYRIAQKNGWLLITDWSRYVTAPTYLADYQPIMRTDKMNPQEILKSFFFLHSHFARRKFTTRYGKNFLLNKRFYKDNIFNVRSYKDFKHKAKIARQLIANYF
jgi:anaerobic magnesium-protoporphyrin IX monomethyl ester cyclase